MGTDMGTDRWGIHLIVALLWDTLTAHAQVIGGVIGLICCCVLVYR
jgi:hypothetical protein